MTEISSWGILEESDLKEVGGILGIGGQNAFWNATNLLKQLSVLVTPNVTEYAWLSESTSEM